MSLLLLLRPREGDGAPAVAVTGVYDQPTPAATAYDSATPSSAGYDQPTPAGSHYDSPTPS